MSDLESSDYRSAYHQFCDWLYGWSVSDGADDEFTKRTPRDINMEHEREKTDAQRLMNTFETLTSVSLRHLKVCYGEIESLIPNIGKGIETGTKTPEEYLSTDLTANTTHLKEKLWGMNLVHSSQAQIEEFKEFELVRMGLILGSGSRSKESYQHSKYSRLLHVGSEKQRR